jgi:hypothetical protein
LRFECQERRTLQRERLTAPGEGEIPVKRLSRRAVSRSLLRGRAAPDMRHTEELERERHGLPAERVRRDVG